MTATYLTAKEINFRKKAVDITLSLDSDYWNTESEREEAIQLLINSVIELTGTDNTYWEVFERVYETNENGVVSRDKIKIDGKYRFKD